MKKTISIFLLLSFLLSFSACTEDDPFAVSNEISNYDTTLSGEALDNKILVKEKEYVYKDKKIYILSAENISKENYSVSITAHYIDENGNEMGIENQYFEQFENGMQKYFLFEYAEEFAAIEYEIDVVPYLGECHASKYKMEFVKLFEYQENIAGGYISCIFSKIATQNQSNRTLRIGRRRLLLLNNKGEIYDIVQFGATTIEPSGDQVYYSNTRVYEMEEKNVPLKWPEELEGTVTGIVIVDSIEVG